jgi:hypothetical protein
MWMSLKGEMPTFDRPSQLEIEKLPHHRSPNALSGVRSEATRKGGASEGRERSVRYSAGLCAAVASLQPPFLLRSNLILSTALRTKSPPLRLRR